MRKRKKIICLCAGCGTKFEKEEFRYNWSKKNNRKIFCSKSCSSDYRSTFVENKCSYCGNDIKVRARDIEKSKTKRFFCNNSCSASFCNLGRKHTETTKNKISSTLRKKYPNARAKCAICKEFQ